MMSGQAHIEMAVKATRLGALDFLEKPISTEKLLLTVENALKLGRLESENSELRRRLGKHTPVLVGRCDAKGDGSGGTRGSERGPGVHSRRDGNGEGVDCADGT